LTVNRCRIETTVANAAMRSAGVVRFTPESVPFNDPQPVGGTLVSGRRLHRCGLVAVVFGCDWAYDLLGEGVPPGELALLLGGQGQVQHGFSCEVSAVGGGD